MLVDQSHYYVNVNSIVSYPILIIHHYSYHLSSNQDFLFHLFKMNELFDFNLIYQLVINW